MAEISVIVPVYKVERYLRKCLDSLVAQTLRDIEIICVDDGSPDGSATILAEYAARDGRIRVIRQANGGLSAARNTGLAQSSAPYVMFCDSDDWVEPTWCEELLRTVRETGADFAVARAFIDGECSQEQRAFLEGNQQLRFHGVQEAGPGLFGRIDPAVWIKIFRRATIERFGLAFPVGAVCEDWPFCQQYLACSEKVAFLDRRLYHYVQRSGSILNGGVMPVKRKLDVIDNWRRLHDFLVTHGRWETWRTTFVDAYVMAVRNTSYEREDVCPEVYEAANAFLDGLSASDFDGLTDECLRGIGMIRDRTLGRLRNLRWKIGPVTVAKYKCSLEGAKAYVLGLRVYKKVFK